MISTGPRDPEDRDVELNEKEWETVKRALMRQGNLHNEFGNKDSQERIRRITQKIRDQLLEERTSDKNETSGSERPDNQ